MTVDSIAKLEALGSAGLTISVCHGAMLLASGPAHAESARWVYSTTPDAMTSEPIQIAATHSVSVLQFNSPYGGPQRATLSLRKHPRKGLAVMLSVERGQFVCAGECRLSARFDDAPAMALPASAADDGSTSAVFVTVIGLFMESLRVSHRVLIEATFYQEGSRVIEFATQGLEWEVTKEERDHASTEFLMARMDTFEHCRSRESHETDCLNESAKCVHAYEDNGPAAGNLATALRCFDAVGARRH